MAFILPLIVKVYIMNYKQYYNRKGQSWTQEEKIQLKHMYDNNCSVPSMASQMDRSNFAIECAIDLFDTQPQQESTTMSHSNNLVTTETKIGTRLASDMSVEEILDAIEREEQYIERLTGFKTQSQAITKLLKRHIENVEALVTIIDARVTE